MTKQQAERMHRLASIGFDWDDANAIRLISMTLHRWAERECGDARGCISRDETTNKPYWESAWGGKPHPIPDRETGALRRLRTIMAKYPGWIAYHQGDPRGAALYLVRTDDIPAGASVDAYYTRGIAVF